MQLLRNSCCATADAQQQMHASATWSLSQLQPHVHAPPAATRPNPPSAAAGSHRTQREPEVWIAGSLLCPPGC